MGIILSGMAEAELTRMADLLPPTGVERISGDELLRRAPTDLSAERIVWFYQAPWLSLKADAAASQEAWASTLLCWLQLHRELLKKRDLIGKRLLLVNADKYSASELCSALTDAGGVALAGPLESSPHLWTNALAKSFEWIAPEYWDVFEMLEAVAWLPGQTPQFRDTLEVSNEGALLEQIRVLSQGLAVPGLLEQLRGFRTQNELFGAQLETAVQEAASLRKTLSLRDDELRKLRTESERNVSQLYSVQAQLEQHYLSNRQMRAALEEATGECDRARRVLSGLMTSQETAAAADPSPSMDSGENHAPSSDAGHRFEQAALHLSGALAEQALLQAQLQHVQAELEDQFQRSAALDKEREKADRRVQRMQAKYPEYVDLRTLAVEAAPDTLVWRAEDVFAAGREFSALAWSIQVEAGKCRLRFETPTPQAVLRRCLGADLVLNFDGGPAQFDWLAPSDRMLLHSLAILMRNSANHASQQGHSVEVGEHMRNAIDMLVLNFAKVPRSMQCESVELLHEHVNADYEHLWLRLHDLRLGERRWDRFDLRLACAGLQAEGFGRHPRLEFHASTGLTSWFAESSDDFGDKLELRFATPDAMDLHVWSQLAEEDQAFIAALIAALPMLLFELEQKRIPLHRPWRSWLVMLGEVLRILQLRASLVAAPA